MYAKLLMLTVHRRFATCHEICMIAAHVDGVFQILCSTKLQTHGGAGSKFHHQLDFLFLGLAMIFGACTSNTKYFVVSSLWQFAILSRKASYLRPCLNEKSLYSTQNPWVNLLEMNETSRSYPT